MTFAELEQSVRDYISQNKIRETIQLLGEFFRDGSDVDEIALQSGYYHGILERQRLGTADPVEVELELNKVRSNILQWLRAKKEEVQYRQQTFGALSIAKDQKADHIHVFLSVASPHNDSQQLYINRLIEYFKECGILLDTVTEWDDRDPLVPIMEKMKQASGCLVLALERYYVQDGVIKRGSQQENKILNQAFPSPWLQIEAALARSFDLPLIILKDQALQNDGLIHDEKQEWGIVRINQQNIKEIDEYPIKNFILNWVNQVKRFDKQRDNRW